MLSIAAHRRCALSPSPPLSRRPLPSRSRHTPSVAVNEPSRHLSPSRSRCAVPCRQGAVTPFIAVEEPSRCTSPSRSRRPCRLTTPATRLAPPSLLSGWLSHCLSSRRHLPSASASHCGHRLSCLLSVRLVVPSPRFSRRHLPSAGASASHRAVTSPCHAHLRPLVRLVNRNTTMGADMRPP